MEGEWALCISVSHLVSVRQVHLGLPQSLKVVDAVITRSHPANLKGLNEGLG